MQTDMQDSAFWFNPALTHSKAGLRTQHDPMSRVPPGYMWVGLCLTSLHDISSVGSYLASHQVGPMQGAQHAVQELLGLLWSESLQLTAVHGAKQAEVDVTICTGKTTLTLTAEQLELLAAGGALHTCLRLKMHFQVLAGVYSGWLTQDCAITSSSLPCLCYMSTGAVCLPARQRPLRVEPKDDTLHAHARPCSTTLGTTTDASALCNTMQHAGNLVMVQGVCVATAFAQRLSGVQWAPMQESSRAAALT